MVVEKHDVKSAINRIIREKGRFPKSRDLQEALDMTIDQVYKCLAVLRDDGYLIDDNGWFSFPRSPEIEIGDAFVALKPEIQDEKKEQEPIKRKIRHTKQIVPIVPKSEEDGYGVPVYILQATMGVIGVGAAIISTYYTTIWLIEFLPLPFALLLSSIMVGFSISAFEAAILFYSGEVIESKKARIAIVASFAFLWIVVSCFSIMSTIAGQYNKYVINLREQTKTGLSSSKETFALIQEQKQDLQKQLQEYRTQLTTLNKVLSGMDDVQKRSENNGVWYDTNFRIQEINKLIDKASSDLTKIREEENAQIQKAVKNGIVLTSKVEIADIPDFYGWLSSVFRTERNRTQFIMSLFPAIFVDIIAPVGIALALFLRKKNKKQYF